MFFILNRSRHNEDFILKIAKDDNGLKKIAIEYTKDIYYIHHYDDDKFEVNIDPFANELECTCLEEGICVIFYISKLEEV